LDDAVGWRLGSTVGRGDGNELGPTEIDGSLDAMRLGSEDGEVLGLDDVVGSTLGRTEGRKDGEELGFDDAVGSRLGSTDGWEDPEGRVVGEELGRFEIEGSLDSIMEGESLGLTEGLELGRTEGIEVDGEIDGALELPPVGTGEGAGVTFFFLRFQRGLRRQPSASFLSLSFFFRSSWRFFRHLLRPFPPLLRLGRSSWCFFLHFFRTWSRRLGSRLLLLLDTG